MFLRIILMHISDLLHQSDFLVLATNIAWQYLFLQKKKTPKQQTNQKPAEFLHARKLEQFAGYSIILFLSEQANHLCRSFSEIK